MTTATLSAVVGYVRRLSAPDTRGLTDRQLLDRFAGERDEAAFTELVRRHGAMVLSACWRVLRHTQDAEDAFQAAFLVLARKASSIRQRDSVGGWLHQVAHRLAVRARIVSDRRRERLTPLSDEFGETPSSLPKAGLGSALVEEVQRLPEPYRSSVVLCYLEGRTQPEAARLLATTAARVNSRLKRAREMLRQRLARRGLVLSSVAVTEALVGQAASAALSPALVRLTARTAIHFVTSQASACGASALAVTLAQGALRSMMTSNLKILFALLLVLALGITGALLAPPPAQGDPRSTASPVANPQPLTLAQDKPAPQPGGKDKRQPSVIVLWMGGGPSQLDTFDPKPDSALGSLFRAIDTTNKGVQFSEVLPNLAKVANHLTLLRSVTHREGDHVRGTYLMRTGQPINGGIDYPTLTCVLAKELGDGRPELPRHFRIGNFEPFIKPGNGDGFLGPQYAPIRVFAADRLGQVAVAPLQFTNFPVPTVEAFEALAKGKGEAHRQAVAKAFALSEEKETVRKSYGPGKFGQGCLLARRLVERGVPVVEIPLGGWDMHNNLVELMKKRGGELDAAFATLVKDLADRKLLDSTLIVWMGEFGRTPRINVGLGRDHYPNVFTVVLAGAGTKPGQVVGKTSADGIKIDERPVTVPELYATIYQAVGVNPARVNTLPGGLKVPLVEKGTKAVKEALR